MREILFSIVSSGAVNLYGLLDFLATCSAQRGLTYVYCGETYLAQKLGKSQRSIRRYLAQLQGAGLLQVQRVGARQNNRYTVIPIDYALQKRGGNNAPCPADRAQLVADRETVTADCDGLPVSETIAQANRQDVNAPSSHCKQYNVRSNVRSGVRSEINSKPLNYSYSNRLSISFGSRREKIDSIADRKKRKEEIESRIAKTIGIESNLALALALDSNETLAEVDAVKQMVRTVAQVAVSGAGVAVNGARVNVNNWLAMVERCSYSDYADLLYRIPRYQVHDVRRYLCAALYNRGVESLIYKPWVIGA